MEHNCIQQEAIGGLKEAVLSVNRAIERLDKRCNGTFDKIGQHISESDAYRERIRINETMINALKEEKLNTTKNAQWRIALIVSVVVSIVNLTATVLLRIFLK